MKDVKFNKVVNNDTVTVDVQLRRREFAAEPVVTFSNSEMIEYLQSEGINLSEYDMTSNPQHTLTSYADKKNEPILDGTWTFKKKEVKKVNKPKTRSYNKGKVKDQLESGD